jgi:hypothetical protein
VKIIKIKSRIRRLISFLLAGVLISGVAFAALSNKVLLKGFAFKTATVELKFLKDLSIGSFSENLTSEISGVSFDGISNGWATDYLVKIHNTSSNSLQVKSFANYTTAEDPASLRYSLYVEVFPWNDINNNGVLDEGELGTSYGVKNFVKWKTEGFSLGDFETNKTYGYVLRFTADGITDSKQGQSGNFDFEFGVLN